jgi:hypothetical protein
MAVFNWVGIFLAGLLALTVILFSALVGGVLTYHHVQDWLVRRREKRKGESSRAP